ncbi:hypothetical protein ABE28_017280 [Peribacillus muralis]|uniref:Uncharacterized protein n=1 Tax=Peribacillus muralis TaxID=264697 RepID=A0A1B3XSC5_9BACI|nr:hypothetical protein [Peribacillus muralis]AOH56118.1 hypothetical protein ABE28_017280 [Peribacillus muralis]
MNFKKGTVVFMSFILLLGTILISLPSKTSATSEIPVGDESLTIIKETDKKFEYILSIDGNKIRYIEITELLEDGSIVIHTKSYNEETNDLLQDFETIIKDEKITDQEIYKNEEMPEPNIENNFQSIMPFASTSSNKSLVSVLNISYKKNYSTKKGTATYAKSGTKTAKLSSKTFDTHARGVDSIRGVENGTLAGWLIAAFTGGGLTAGKIISLQTLKTVIKNVAGPVAVVANAWALGQWLYHYNTISYNFSKIK